LPTLLSTIVESFEFTFDVKKIVNRFMTPSGLFSGRFEAINYTICDFLVRGKRRRVRLINFFILSMNEKLNLSYRRSTLIVC
jgi:hypothetical protein